MRNDGQRILDILNGKRKAKKHELSPDLLSEMSQSTPPPPPNLYKPTHESKTSSNKSKRLGVKSFSPAVDYNRYNNNATSISSFKSNNFPSVNSQYFSKSYASNGKRAFQALYGKHKPYKKHKEWTYDGFILIADNSVTLFDASGKKVGRFDTGKQEFPRKFEEGTQIVISSYECQLSSEINVSDFESGAFFAPDDWQITPVEPSL